MPNYGYFVGITIHLAMIAMLFDFESTAYCLAGAYELWYLAGFWAGFIGLWAGCFARWGDGSQGCAPLS